MVVVFIASENITLLCVTILKILIICYTMQTVHSGGYQLTGNFYWALFSGICMRISLIDPLMNMPKKGQAIKSPQILFIPFKRSHQGWCKFLLAFAQKFYGINFRGSRTMNSSKNSDRYKLDNSIECQFLLSRQPECSRLTIFFSSTRGHQHLCSQNGTAHWPCSPVMYH